MKHILIAILIIATLLTACALDVNESDASALIVSDGSNEKSYSRNDLAAMPTSEAAFKDINYVGVSLSDLVSDAGYDPQALQAVKVVASDGYSVNYDPAIFTRRDVIVAYAQTDGALAEDDGSFRMVLPGEEGKLNLRMLTEVVVIP